MTDFPEDLFAQVYKRAPNDQDREHLLSVKAALGLSSRDEMWNLILVLERYIATITSGRLATIREINKLLEEMRDIPDKLGPVADAAAQQAIQRIIDKASDKIATESARKSVTTADRISRTQFTVAAIAGCISTCVVAAATATALYFILDSRGICAENQIRMDDGVRICVISRE